MQREKRFRIISELCSLVAYEPILITVDVRVNSTLSGARVTRNKGDKFILQIVFPSVISEIISQPKN